MRRPAAPRGASTRYPSLSTNGEALGAPGGVRRPLAGPHELVDVATEITCGAEAVVWIHETAMAAWELPDRLGPDHADTIAELLGREVRPIGETGWLAVDRVPVPLHLAFPAYSGDFAGLAHAGELLAAVEHFRQAVGLAYVISAAKTVHTLVGMGGRLEESTVEPLDPPRVRSAWALPANVWGLADLEPLEAAGRRWVRCFDQNAAYLAAWQGLTLPYGDWTRLGAGTLEAGPESGRLAGYWLVDPANLPAGLGTFDPWRQHGDAPGPRWITTPLAQLAVELLEAPLVYEAAVVASERCRALDVPGVKLRDAWATLRAVSTPAAAAALAVLKDGYSTGTSWFAGGPQPPAPLGRPAWMHTIHDRRIANAWRSLEKATPAPFAFAEIDTALFAVTDADEIPDGLRCDGGLGSWKPKGPPIPIHAALEALAAGGPRAVIQLTEAVPA